MLNVIRKFTRRMSQMHLEHELEVSSLIGIIVNLNYLKMKQNSNDLKFYFITDSFVHIILVKLLLFLSKINGVIYTRINSNNK